MNAEQQRQKYLRNRAVISPWQLAGSRRRDVRAAVVIPALAESASLPRTLASLAENPVTHLEQTLIIVVVNNRKDALWELRDDNRATLDRLAAHPFPELHLAWIDAASVGLELPAADGVGLARKIGFDAALSRLDHSRDPLLISLDADTLVEADYLPALFEHFSAATAGGAVVPFRHQPDSDPRREAAIRDYELYLRSYLFGLQRAGSPYAYHSIGSAFACRAGSYIEAGGMNRRLAGEDFYFLQQLNKITGVRQLSGTIVHPAARFSERVPFGTGQVLQSHVSNRARPYRIVSAGAFEVLKQWLALVEHHPESAAAELLEKAGEISTRLAEFLSGHDFMNLHHKLRRNHPTPQQRVRAFHGWFDALRSRRLLSRLIPDNGADIAADVAELLRWGGYPDVMDKTDQLRLLESWQVRSPL